MSDGRRDLVVKKMGDEWCLFTADGSRKLGCHPTEKEAHAQEAAIKARQGSGADPGSIRFELADIDVSEGTYETLDNGDVKKWVPLAEPGEKWVNGGVPFDITPELVQQGIKNFEARDKAPLPVTFGHLDESGAPARAWIEDIELRDDERPWGLLHFLKPTWDKIQAGEYKYFSLEFYPQDLDQKGKEIGFGFAGGAILNDPFFPSLRIDQANRGPRMIRLSRFVNSGQSRKESNVMTDAEKAAADKAAADKAAADKAKLESVHIEGEKVTLSREQYRELSRVRDENAKLRGELEESKAANESNESRIVKLEKRDKALRIRAAVKTLQRDHRVIVPLGDYAIDSSDQECLEWLSGTPMGVSSVEGLEKLARDQEASAHLPRLPGGKEVSGGTDRVPPADLTSEAGRNEAVRRHATQLKKDFAKEELELMLKRRGQTLEDFARQELATDHPEYKKVLLEKK